MIEVTHKLIHVKERKYSILEFEGSICKVHNKYFLIRDGKVEFINDSSLRYKHYLNNDSLSSENGKEYYKNELELLKHKFKDTYPSEIRDYITFKELKEEYES